MSTVVVMPLQSVVVDGQQRFAGDVFEMKKADAEALANQPPRQVGGPPRIAIVEDAKEAVEVFYDAATKMFVDEFGWDTRRHGKPPLRVLKERYGNVTASVSVQPDDSKEEAEKKAANAKEKAEKIKEAEAEKKAKEGDKS